MVMPRQRGERPALTCAAELLVESALSEGTKSGAVQYRFSCHCTVGSLASSSVETDRPVGAVRLAM